MDLGFADATTVIAGGTRGIGLATALCLAEQGARVGVIGRNEAQLAEAATTLANAGSPEVLTLNADLSSAADVEAVFATVGARWGGLNVLVNAAGPMGAGRFEDLGDAQWTAAFEEGVLSAVRCVRAPWARVVSVTAMSVQH
jgi:3-oxoacyl-[acyl-carrier protein] reductase